MIESGKCMGGGERLAKSGMISNPFHQFSKFRGDFIVAIEHNTQGFTEIMIFIYNT